ncbi:MAG: methyltransferase domain-containing protein [Bacteroidetes bacterium]|nr:methyltransferase domain-containing protein [Bacteroidota bacterium]
MKQDRYRYHLTPGGPGLTRTVLAELPEEVRRDEQASLLLMGCRQGENALALAEVFPGRIIGIEEDSEPIFYGKMAVSERGLASRVSLQFMSPVSTNFRAGQFRIIILEGMLSGYTPGRVLREALRLLDDRGFLLLSDSCWLADDVPTYVRDVWESPDHKILTPPQLRQLLEERGMEILHFEDRSRVLDSFYRQFEDTVRDIAHGGFEGMKHRKSLIKHYKHEIDVYRKHGGDRYMGYFSMVARKSSGEAGQAF